MAASDEVIGFYLRLHHEFPNATVDDCAVLIRELLTRDQVLDLASEVLIMDTEVIETTDELALRRIVGLILHLEGGAEDNDDDDDGWRVD